MDRDTRSRRGDVGIALAVGVLYVTTVMDAGAGIAAGVVAAGSGAGLGVTLVRRRDDPLRVAAVVVVLDAVFHALTPGLVIPFAGMVALWAVTLRRGPRQTLPVLVGVSATAGINGFRTSAEETIFVVLLVVCVWALAEAARNRIEAAEESGRRAISEERARIARELHDVVAHSVSVIVVQAAAAGDVFDERPDQVRTALTSIERSGREALAELRRLVVAVRPGEDAPAAPQAGLSHVAVLAEQLRSAGLEVVVRQEGEPFPLPAGVDLSAFRIVQEALTNTLRHARATTAEVTLRYQPGVVELDVVDDGRGTVARALGAGAAGVGLVGMHERATMLGGDLEAGPTAHGGFRVRARLPVEATG